MTSLQSYEYYLSRLAENQKEVFFLQIGAADGRSFDPLYPFASRYNWSGLLVEPLSDLFDELKRNYGHCGGVIFENAAISDTFESRTMKRVPLDAVRAGKVPRWALGISSFYSDRNAIGGKKISKKDFQAIQNHLLDVTVPCVPLSHLLHKHKISKIDVVNIDTEGHDFHVLSQLDLDSVRPTVILFESCNLPASELQPSIQYLERCGYACANDGFNVLAVLEAHFTSPPSEMRGRQPGRLNIGVYSETRWALGSIHSELINRLSSFNIHGEILDFEKAYIIHQFRTKLYQFDYIMTNPGAALALTRGYRFPPSRIVLVCHGEPELIQVCNSANRRIFDAFLEFAVVSESLCASALTLGIRPPSAILPIGVNCDFFLSEPAEELRRVGYAASYSRKNAYDVEIKRGELARRCAVNAGLEFAAVDKHSLSQMPDFYRSIDALVVPSYQEGAGLPALEGAAAGRLVIGTPTGHFPRCAYEGAGILAPLMEDEFADFTTNTLLYYKSNPELFRIKCKSIQAASRMFDWNRFVPVWAEFLWKTRNQLPLSR